MASAGPISSGSGSPTASPGGKKTSPLDDVHVSTWPKEWISEFNELLTALRRITDLEPMKSELLKGILTNSLVTTDQLAEAGVKFPQTVKDRKPRYGQPSPVDTDSEQGMINRTVPIPRAGAQSSFASDEHPLLQITIRPAWPPQKIIHKRTIMSLILFSITLAMAAAVFMAKALPLLNTVASLMTSIATALQWNTDRRTSTQEQQDRARAYLAKQMAVRDKEERAALQVDQSKLIGVQWARDPLVMDHAFHSLTDESEFVGSTANVDEITDFVLHRTQFRRVVFTGPGGMGKSTLALGINHSLLEKQSSEHPHPLPVLLNPATWRLDRAETMEEWVERSLREEYPQLRRRRLYGGNPVGELFQSNELFMIIDGIDELDHYWATEFLRRMDDLPEHPFILTCRPDEFRDALPPAKAINNTVVLISEPLNSNQISMSIHRLLKPQQAQDTAWNAALKEIQKHPEGILARSLRTPLDLWLLKAIYITPDRDPTPILDRQTLPSTHEIRRHLFENLIPELMRRSLSEDNKAYRMRKPGETRSKFDNPEKSMRYLSYVAYLMQRAKTTSFEWWNLNDLIGRSQTRLAKASAFYFLFMAFGIVTAEPNLNSARWAFISLWGFLGSLIFFAIYKNADDLPSPVITRRWKDAKSALREEWKTTFTVPLIATGGTWTVCFVGLAWIAISAASKELSINPAIDGAILAMKAPTFIYTLSLVATAPSLLVLLCVLAWKTGRSRGIVFRFITIIMHLLGRMPIKTLSFMEDMCQYGIMRSSGPIYQFRHIELQEYLADWHEENYVRPRKIGAYQIARRIFVCISAAVALSGALGIVFL